MVDQPPAEQARQLAALPDRALARAVAEMLQADSDDGTAVWSDSGTPPLARVLARQIARDAVLQPGDTLGDFTVLDLQAQGGMGTVYRAQQRTPRREVALKVMHPWVNDPSLLHRFQREAEALASLDHPSIPTVYAADTAGTPAWIAMAWVRGEPLDAWLASHQPPLHVRLRLAIDLCRAAGAAHALGIVHRDLKPANVLVQDEASVCLVDFGVALDPTDTADERRLGLGTPAWFAPEQDRNEPATERTDVWALGLLTWLMLTGRPAALGREAATRDDALNALAKLPMDIPAVLRRALNPDPTARYANGSELAGDLHAALYNLPVTAQPDSIVYRLRCLSRRHPRSTRLGAAAFALAALTLLAVQAAASLAAWQAGQEASAWLARAEATLAEPTTPAQADTLHAQWERDLSRAPLQRSNSASAGWRLAARLAERRTPTAPTTDSAGLQLADPALRNLAHAARAAQTPSDVQEATAALVQAFAARTRWTDARRTALSLSPQAMQAHPRARAAAALATRDLHAAGAALTGLDPIAPLLTALAPQTRTAHRSGPVVTHTPDGPRVHLVDGVQQTLHQVGTTPSLPIQTSWELPGLYMDWPRVHWVPEHGGWYLTNTGRESSHMTSLADPSQPPTLLPYGHLTRLARVPDQATPTYLAGFGAYPRRLATLRWTDQGWKTDPAAPSIAARASDVTDIVIAEVDDDPWPEAFVSLGPWWSYAVVRLDADADGNWTETYDVQLGFVNELALLDTPTGTQLVALKSDRYANPEILGDPTPYGQPSGLYLLRPTPTGFEQTLHLRPPLREPVSETIGLVHGMVGDGDGDGWQDVAIDLEYGEQQHATWLLRQTPSGELAGALVPGQVPVGWVNLDDDSADELIVRTVDGDHQVIVWGAGTPPAKGHTEEPVLTARSFLPHLAPTDSAEALEAWTRARAFLQTGLVAEAHRSLRDAVAYATDHDAARLRLARGLLLTEAAPEHALAPLQRVLQDSTDCRLRTPAGRALGEAARAVGDLGALWPLASDAPDCEDMDPSGRAHALAYAGAPRLTWTATPTRSDQPPMWQLPSPELAQLDQAGGLRLDVFNQPEPSAFLPLQAGPAPDFLDLKATLSAHDLRPGANPALTVDFGDVGSVGVALRGRQAQDGTVEATCQVMHDKVRTLAELRVPYAATLPFDVQIVVHDTTITCRLRSGEARTTAHDNLTAPLEPLTRLSIREVSGGTYGVPRSVRSALTLQHLELVGGAHDGAAAVPSDQTGHWAVVRGDAPGAEGSPVALALHALQSRDPARAVQALRTLAQQPDSDPTLMRMLHTRPATDLPWFEAALSPARYDALRAQTLVSTARYASAAWRLEQLDNAWLDSLQTPPAYAASLRLARAKALLQTGQPTRALRDVRALWDTALGRALPPGEQNELPLLAARVAATLGQDADARTYLRHALQSAGGSPSLRQQLSREALLAPHMPPDTLRDP